MRLFLFLLLFPFCAMNANAASVKLGAGMPAQTQTPTMLRPSNTEITCTENSDCRFFEECVGLKCVKICQPNPCAKGKHCIPTGPDQPHTYKCVECVYHDDCPSGYECVKGFKCAKKDPCRQAVCSPGAPFCIPEPYKSLPYTCVQCTDDTHCPPIGGLSRKCVNNFCLFNIDGNIPAPSVPAPVPAEEPYEYADENGEEYDDGFDGYDPRNINDDNGYYE